MSKWEELSDKRKKSLIEASNRYVQKHYDRIHFNVKQGVRERWQKEASMRGFKYLSEFIIFCVEKVIASGIDDSN